MSYEKFVSDSVRLIILRTSWVKSKVENLDFDLHLEMQNIAVWIKVFGLVFHFDIKSAGLFRMITP